MPWPPPGESQGRILNLASTLSSFVVRNLNNSLLLTWFTTYFSSTPSPFDIKSHQGAFFERNIRQVTWTGAFQAAIRHSFQRPSKNTNEEKKKTNKTNKTLKITQKKATKKSSNERKIDVYQGTPKKYSTHGSREGKRREEETPKKERKKNISAV